MKSRVLAWAIAIAIAAGAFEPFFLRIFFIDRARFGAMLAALPYQKLPGSRRFLLDVRARTHEGDAIAIAAPLQRASRWEGGYDYLYARAPYLLAGRRVIPLLDAGNRQLTENLRLATYVAAYRCDPVLPGFVVVWRSPDGELLRRVP